MQTPTESGMSNMHNYDGPHGQSTFKYKHPVNAAASAKVSPKSRISPTATISTQNEAVSGAEKKMVD